VYLSIAVGLQIGVTMFLIGWLTILWGAAREAKVDVPVRNIMSSKGTYIIVAAPPVAPGEYAAQGEDAVFFLPSDISDPHTNGRTYEVHMRLAVSPLCYVLLSVVLLWSAIATFSLLRCGRQREVRDA
jgi:hypothetical protein